MTTRAQYRLYQLARILRAPYALGSTSQIRLAATATQSDPDQFLTAISTRLDNVLMRELRVDPHSQSQYPNRRSRAVLWGHYVETLPTPLKEPFLVTVSSDMLHRVFRLPSNALGTSSTDTFARIFAGDVSLLPPAPNSDNASGSLLSPWATPYAVSVFGMPIPAPCPFNGNGYGDGRAMSLGQFRPDPDVDMYWELQLKGCGPTPFARNFDGRAVLRSSVREYLVSEAMHAMGVPTTRALSLVVSGSDRVHRAWYEHGDWDYGDKAPASMKRPPNMMRHEQCAVVCRAAPSFLRVGQVELFARRVQREGLDAAVQKEHLSDLRQLVRYALRTLKWDQHGTVVPTSTATTKTVDDDAGDDDKGDKGDKYKVDASNKDKGDAQSTDDDADVAVRLMKEVARRHAILVTQWLRVGYVQGNMNSDNCLLGGQTMDYGPFGFLERYDALWTPFTSDPEAKFGFERQPGAAQMNMISLAQALTPLVGQRWPELKAVIETDFKEMFEAESNEFRRRKLGLREWNPDSCPALYSALQSLLPGTDWTLFWRQLSTVRVQALREDDDATLIRPLGIAFYEAPEEGETAQWAAWVRQWLGLVETIGIVQDEQREADMKAVSPKYIPREWMLYHAYHAAEAGDWTVFHELEQLFLRPYDEHPHLEAKYFRKTPKDFRNREGISFYN